MLRQRRRATVACDLKKEARQQGGPIAVAYEGRPILIGGTEFGPRGRPAKPSKPSKLGVRELACCVLCAACCVSASLRDPNMQPSMGMDSKSAASGRRRAPDPGAETCGWRPRRDLQGGVRSRLGSTSASPMRPETCTRHHTRRHHLWALPGSRARTPSPTVRASRARNAVRFALSRQAGHYTKTRTTTRPRPGRRGRNKAPAGPMQRSEMKHEAAGRGRDISPEFQRQAPGSAQLKKQHQRELHDGRI
jgi:hypothetical protein